jgi:Archaeal fructose-1,6-bisphosphatase and related enzymes of inositol monophosphatase family
VDIDLQKALELAMEMAVAGGEQATTRYGPSAQARLKPDGTWVTEADEAAEAAVRKIIAGAFPGHNVLGEEEGSTAAQGGPPNDGAPTWIVDPIDGTHNYMAGIPVWGTLIGLRLDGEMVLGVAHAPALGETYDAARGLGARMNGNPIEVSGISVLGDATLVSTGFEDFENEGLSELYVELTRRTKRSRGFGDFWGHMLVARGAAEIMVEPILSTWDYAPLTAIVEEAGGRITRLDGEPCTHEGSCLTTNGKLHEPVLALARPHLTHPDPSGS